MQKSNGQCSHCSARVGRPALARVGVRHRGDALPVDGESGRPALARVGVRHRGDALPVEMAMDKYPPGITTPYPYPRHKNNPIRSPIYIGGYGFTPYQYPCGYELPIGSPVPTKIKYLSKYYIIQMSSIYI
jgi:hypothetical protein